MSPPGGESPQCWQTPAPDWQGGSCSRREGPSHQAEVKYPAPFPTHFQGPPLASPPLLFLRRKHTLQMCFGGGGVHLATAASSIGSVPGKVLQLNCGFRAGLWRVITNSSDSSHCHKGAVYPKNGLKM